MTENTHNKKCPVCGSNTRRYGFAGRKTGSIPRYMCKVCGKFFVEDKIMPIHERCEYMSAKLKELSIIYNRLVEEAQHEEGDYMAKSRSNKLQVSEGKYLSNDES